MLAPRTVEEVGIRRIMLENLALKTVHMLGEVTVPELAAHLKLRRAVVDELVLRLRKEMLVEVTGMNMSAYRIVASGAGKARATEMLELNQYVGPAPVSMTDYIAQVRAQSSSFMEITPADVERAFDDLVLSPKAITQLGTAMVSGMAIFLYGTSGTGKTSVAERMGKLFGTSHVWIPYAVEMDGQIITVYDPLVHVCVEQSQEDDYDPDHDGRWVLCQRPLVLAGGELTIEMLDLQFNPTTKFYAAPLQMKANNGLLIIDDFGRQRVRPEELLNRWVVPLDRHTDFLTVIGGRKLEVPFDVFIVFATNMDPSTLVDEAFLRRLQNKVHLGTVTREQFHEIFRRVCADQRLDYQPGMVDELIETITEHYRQPLRPCYPRDIVNQIRWTARYHQQPPVVDRTAIADACYNYFVQS
jgi:predicted ATPase with chaperone activity